MVFQLIIFFLFYFLGAHLLTPANTVSIKTHVTLAAKNASTEALAPSLCHPPVAPPSNVLALSDIKLRFVKLPCLTIRAPTAHAKMEALAAFSLCQITLARVLWDGKAITVTKLTTAPISLADTMESASPCRTLTAVNATKASPDQTASWTSTSAWKILAEAVANALIFTALTSKLMSWHARKNCVYFNQIFV